MKDAPSLRNSFRVAATRGKLTEAAMAAPFFVLFSLFTLLPVAASIVLSFTLTISKRISKSE